MVTKLYTMKNGADTISGYTVDGAEMNVAYRAATGTVDIEICRGWHWQMVATGLPAATVRGARRSAKLLELAA